MEGDDLLDDSFDDLFDQIGDGRQSSADVLSAAREEFLGTAEENDDDDELLEAVGGCTVGAEDCGSEFQSLEHALNNIEQTTNANPFFPRPPARPAWERRYGESGFVTRLQNKEVIDLDLMATSKRRADGTIKGSENVARAAQAKLEQAKEAIRKRDAWTAEQTKSMTKLMPCRIRRMNHVPDPNTTGPRALRTNGQDWDARPVIELAFGAIGTSSTHHSADTQSTLTAIMLVAYSWAMMQTRAVERLLNSFVSLSWMMLQWCFDATPMRRSFGSMLQNEAAPNARYFITVRNHGKEHWKQLTYNEFMDHRRSLKSNKVAAPRSGTVEILGVEGNLFYPHEVESPSRVIVRSEKLLPSAMAMQRSNASCLFSSIQRAEPALCLDKLIRFAAQCLTFLLFLLGSDSAKSCIRFKHGFMAKVRQMVAQMAQEFPGCVLKVLFILMYCVSHKFKTILEKAAWSNEVVTSLYSLSFVCNHAGYHRRLVSRIEEVARDNVEPSFSVCPTDAEVRHSKRCFNATLRRRFRTRARVGIVDSREEEEVDAFIEGIIALLPCGYQLRGQKWVHPCRPGCPCGGDFDKLVILIALELERLFLIHTPHNASPSRWWTQEENIAFCAIGILLFGVLLTMFDDSFEGVLEPPPPAPGVIEPPIEEMRRYCCKQLTNSRTKLRSSSFCSKVLVLMVTSEPLDHVSQTLQHLDEQGGSLLEMVDPHGLLCWLQESLGCLLFADEEGDVMCEHREMLVTHFRGGVADDADGLLTEDEEESYSMLRQAVYSASAQVWHELEVPHQNLPLILTRTQSATASEEEKEEIGQRACYGCSGCRDRSFTEPVVEVKRTPEALLACPFFAALLQAVIKGYKETNMHLERILALARQSTVYSKFAPTIERTCGATRLSAVIKEWKATMHTDLRNPQARVDSSGMATAGRADKDARALFNAFGKRKNGWTKFVDEQLPLWRAQRRLTGESTNPKGFITGEGALRWRGLTVEEQDRYASKAKEENANRRARGPEENEELSTPVLDMPFGLAQGSDWPVTEEDVEDTAASVGGGSSQSGLRNKGEKLRYEKRSSIYVEDENLLPSTESYSVHLTCWQAHPGLCIKEDKAYFEEALALGDAIKKFFNKEHCHQYYVITHYRSRPDSLFEVLGPVQVYVYMSFSSGTPKLASFGIQEAGHTVPLRLSPLPRAPHRFPPASGRRVRKRVTSESAYGLAKRLIVDDGVGLLSGFEITRADIGPVTCRALPVRGIRGQPGAVVVKDGVAPSPELAIWSPRKKKAGQPAKEKQAAKVSDFDMDMFSRMVAGLEDLSDVVGTARPAPKPAKRLTAGKIRYIRPKAGPGECKEGEGTEEEEEEGQEKEEEEEEEDEETDGDEPDVDPGKMLKRVVKGHLGGSGPENENDVEMEETDSGDSPRPKEPRHASKGGRDGCGRRGRGPEEKRSNPPEKKRKSQREVTAPKAAAPDPPPRGFAGGPSGGLVPLKSSDGGGEGSPIQKQDAAEEAKRKAADEDRKKQEEAEEEKRKAADEDRKRKLWLDDLVKRSIGDMRERLGLNTGMYGWALARSNASAGCRGCGQVIEAQGFRLRYRRPDDSRCAQDAVSMSASFDRYYHIRASCLQHETAPFVELPEELGRDVKPLPPRMGETEEAREEETNAGIDLAMKEAAEARRLRQSTATVAAETGAPTPAVPRADS